MKVYFKDGNEKSFFEELNYFLRSYSRNKYDNNQVLIPKFEIVMLTEESTNELDRLLKIEQYKKDSEELHKLKASLETIKSTFKDLE